MKMEEFSLPLFFNNNTQQILEYPTNGLIMYGFSLINLAINISP
jgi:hypothetical protein